MQENLALEHSETGEVAESTRLLFNCPSSSSNPVGTIIWYLRKPGNETLKPLRENRSALVLYYFLWSLSMCRALSEYHTQTPPAIVLHQTFDNNNLDSSMASSVASCSGVCSNTRLTDETRGLESSASFSNHFLLRSFTDSLHLFTYSVPFRLLVS